MGGAVEGVDAVLLVDNGAAIGERRCGEGCVSVGDDAEHLADLGWRADGHGGDVCGCAECEQGEVVWDAFDGEFGAAVGVDPEGHDGQACEGQGAVVAREEAVALLDKDIEACAMPGGEDLCGRDQRARAARGRDGEALVDAADGHPCGLLAGGDHLFGGGLGAAWGPP